jgi:hypothetical protein
VWIDRGVRNAHAKTMVIDGKVSLMGSMNWSSGAEVGTFLRCAGSGRYGKSEKGRKEHPRSSAHSFHPLMGQAQGLD